jgi:hypothetical protein
MRCIEFLHQFFFGIPNFGIEIPISQFSTAEFEKNFPTGIFGIKNRIGILLPIGVPEIGTKNLNSQPSSKGTRTGDQTTHLADKGTWKRHPKHPPIQKDATGHLD